MAIRKTQLVTGEYYHIYNRGVDKRAIFEDDDDVRRFFQSMQAFNVEEPIGSLYEKSFKKPSLGSPTPKLELLVKIVAYCLNLNHYHFLLKQEKDKGITEFMRRLNGGYTNYFNNRNSRNGVLFQGKFKSIHVNSNEYLLYLSAYINKNYIVHQISDGTTDVVGSRSSWKEYAALPSAWAGICEKNMILEQFKNITAYEKFVDDVVDNISTRRQEEKDINHLVIE
ncbi:MAG: hypothetical protein COZ49_03020 [Candidatus Yonathbacteria bacterium CG_4_10_14_3_um_filter_47_65]|uniref:Transposase IS200-like domain-containing protein n=2 Tax=Parcubacteria group TaxID=1794811 RepID=A0A2M8D5Y4_9BACT|nr:MAG: hypothetical protein AUJ44_02745 [Candidatus Nomurabacteria bacterium CG1_02_47_685]PIP04009.1 MAG: hypothetical protein COX54_01400 [Candidatus Yonathbacteria bacterium CG23_combo_of_CG06-09_8_20_14_all_46_18]PIQ31225.1 MAG: hypothetical protein COW61_04140 [Candidatus Yonathbacteria bacterium CG17_big_fil_post_rev_8_21_14_2_50_46_19]PIX56251.1 MAG: hypothetical protein COZ49_03020 [Candidatus Yonathbacteria bacterium CG_4_10_14_3_um_filter_47_65]PIY57461.1 MAG: hypothetical protein CO